MKTASITQLNEIAGVPVKQELYSAIVMVQLKAALMSIGYFQRIFNI